MRAKRRPPAVGKGFSEVGRWKLTFRGLWKYQEQITGARPGAILRAWISRRGRTDKDEITARVVKVGHKQKHGLRARTRRARQQHDGRTIHH